MDTSAICYFLALACLIIGVESWTNKPSFCKTLDCPRYTVLSYTNNYELRSYDMSYWVTAKDSPWQYQYGNSAFYKLFRYISGNNVQGLKMKMTAPVLNFYKDNEVTMAFMFPLSLYGKAPEPRDSSVSLLTYPAAQIYVKQYSGEDWAWGTSFSVKLQQFRSQLAADNVTLTEDAFWTAGYDSPRTRVSSKHHEIWILKP